MRFFFLFLSANAIECLVLLANQSNFVFKCVSNSSCSHNGFCKNSTHCQCDDYWVTSLNNTNPMDNIQCNYKQLAKEDVFIVSFLFGTLAADQFFLGNIVLGLLKLLVPGIGYLLGFTISLVGKKTKKETLEVYGKVLEFFSTIAILLWWFIDWILVITNVYADNNGMELK